MTDPAQNRERDNEERERGNEENDNQNDEPNDAVNGGENDALLSRLRVIEDQPLERRAEAFAQVHKELRARLESGDSAISGSATSGSPGSRPSGSG